MRYRLAATLAVVAVALSGCGGSGSSSHSAASGGSGAITPSAYRTRVDKICAEVNTAITALPASEATTVPGAQQELRLATSALEQIKAVTPPQSLSRQVHVFVGDLERSDAVARQIVSDLKARNVAELEPLVAKARTLNDKGNQDATALGLPSCAQNPQPSAKAA
jgi:hypothetical protein